MRVFITGGAGGLGRALATQLAAEGHRVLIGDYDVDALKKTASELGVQGTSCDVRRADDVEAAAAWTNTNWDGIDLLINNAGVAYMGKLEGSSIADWQWMIDINLLGVVRTTRAFLPQLKSNQGRILNIASMSGLLFLPETSMYSASKAGIVALSESLMLELEPDGVGVHVACPAFFRTDLARNMRCADEKSAAVTKRMVEHARQGADDVATGMLQSLSRGDRYILTHRSSLRSWLLKRLLPVGMYLGILRKQLSKMNARLQSKVT